MACAKPSPNSTRPTLDTYWSGRTTLVTQREHIPVYDNVFRHFFLDEELSAPDDRG